MQIRYSVVLHKLWLRTQKMSRNLCSSDSDMEACRAHRILEDLRQSNPYETPLWKLAPQLILEDSWLSIAKRPWAPSPDSFTAKLFSGNQWHALYGLIETTEPRDPKRETPLKTPSLEACVHNASLRTYGRAPHGIPLWKPAYTTCTTRP